MLHPVPAWDISPAEQSRAEQSHFWDAAETMQWRGWLHYKRLIVEAIMLCTSSRAAALMQRRHARWNQGLRLPLPGNIHVFQIPHPQTFC